MSFLTEQVLRDVEDKIVSFAGQDNAKTLVDIGCWDGRATKRYAAACGADHVEGIEIFDEQIAQAADRGIEVHKVDLEAGRLPGDGSRADLVVCNQVFEHLKGVFDLLSEIHRILKPGGRFIFSVPNLASVHNRLMMLAGLQPTSIRIVGPHVRGFTYGHTRKFLTLNGLFEIRMTAGCGFYPFPIVFGRHLGRLWPGGSHTFVILLKKTGVEAPSWSDVVREGGYQTVYFDPGTNADSTDS